MNFSIKRHCIPKTGIILVTNDGTIERLTKYYKVCFNLCRSPLGLKWSFSSFVQYIYLHS